MVRFFTNFGAKRNPNGWVTHGMHASMPCRLVQSIKTDRCRKREKKKIEKEMKEENEGVSCSEKTRMAKNLELSYKR